MSIYTLKSVLKSKKQFFKLNDCFKKSILPNNIEIIFRPLTHTDSRLWEVFIDKCSKDSLYSRFQTTSAVLKDQGEIYCQTDYENTITIGVFNSSDENEELIGAAWLLRDNVLNQVELALLIADKWQHKGIGTELSEFCRIIIINWDVDSVKGTTTLNNFEIKQLLSKNKINYKSSFDDNSLEFELSFEEIIS